MPKNIVALLDGTSQEGGRRVSFNTNVYKTYTLLEERSARQVVFYDRGVGTGWRKVTGNVGGAGISNRILGAYRFIHDHYEYGDRIFLLGFSRGATEVRSLANFLEIFQFLPESRPDLIKRAWKIYRTRPPLRWWARRRIAKYRRYGVGAHRWKVPILWLTRRWTDEWDLRDPFDVVTALLPERTRFEYRKLYGQTWEERISELKEETRNFTSEEVAEFISNADGFFPGQRRLGENPAKDAIWSDVAGASWHMYVSGAFDNTDDPAEWLRVFRRDERAAQFLSASGSSRMGARYPIHFLGCFDTVAALGLPFPRLKALTDRIPGMHHSFHDLTLSGLVTHAYQALALDEARRAFLPEVWKAPSYQRSHQVWFSGVHTDIGGGYLERGLSEIALSWMLRMGHAAGLLLKLKGGVQLGEDPNGVLHDSRDTLLKKWLFGKQTRKPAEMGDVILHRTVIERMNSDAPIWEWKDGRPVEVTAHDYRNRLRSVLGGALDSGLYHVDEQAPVLFDLGELVEAQKEIWNAWANAGYPLHWPMSSIHKAWDCAQRWEREKALELLADVPENGFKMEIGLIYGGLGELDRAFEYLDEAFAEHPTSLRDLSLHGWAADLHQDPRFDELIEKLGKFGVHPLSRRVHGLSLKPLLRAAFRS